MTQPKIWIQNSGAAENFGPLLGLCLEKEEISNLFLNFLLELRMPWDVNDLKFLGIGCMGCKGFGLKRLWVGCLNVHENR